MGRDLAKRPGLGRVHALVVRLVQQHQSDDGSDGAPRIRNAGGVPDERRRLIELSGYSGGDPAQCASWTVRERRPWDAREVSSIRRADGRVVGGSTTVGV